MFCDKCGKEISDKVTFCPQCGNQIVKKQVITNSDGNGKFVLTINRARQKFAVSSAIKIVIDDIGEYMIMNGETLDIPVSPGVHTIAFSCGLRKKAINTNVAGNLTLNIKWARGSGGLDVDGDQPFSQMPVQKNADVFRYLGIIASIVALLSLFLDWAKLQSSVLTSVGDLLGIDGNYNFFELVRDGNAPSGFVLSINAIMIGSIAIVAVSHCLCRPKTSSWGCVGMASMLFLVVRAISDSRAYNYGIGFYLYVVAFCIAVVSVFAYKKPKKTKGER